MRIKRIGHVGLRVPDVKRVVEFYERALDLEVCERNGESFFLRCNDDHHCIGIYPGHLKSLHHLGLEMASTEDLKNAKRELEQQGIELEARPDFEPGHGESFCIRDPDGNLVELYSEMDRRSNGLKPSGVRPIKFGHLTLMVQEVTHSVQFYCQVLGFRVSDTVEDQIAWLRCNEDHHGVAFIKATHPQVHHYAFELKDWNAFKSVCDHLSNNNVPVIYGPSRHGPGRNLFMYLGDTYGNIIELFAEIDQILDEKNYKPKNWKVGPKTIDVWRALAPPDGFFDGEGRSFNDWSAGSSVIGSGWSVVKADDFTGLDPAAKITVPTPEVPEFKIEIPRFTLSCSNPMDHAKALIYTDRRFPTGRGLSVSVDMAVEVFGTESNPYDADPDDPRLASGSLALRDDSTGVVLNFEVSNRRIMALREVLPITAPVGTGGLPHLADTRLTDVRIEPGSWHRYEIRYHPGDDRLLAPGPDVAQWFVDDKLVHQVRWVATAEPPRAPVVKPIRFQVGMAIFTLLDNLPDGKGGQTKGLDPEYEQTIFGQGVAVRWKNLEVTS